MWLIQAGSQGSLSHALILWGSLWILRQGWCCTLGIPSLGSAPQDTFLEGTN